VLWWSRCSKIGITATVVTKGDQYDVESSEHSESGRGGVQFGKPVSLASRYYQEVLMKLPFSTLVSVGGARKNAQRHDNFLSR
jgi:hypothetical protein